MSKRINILSRFALILICIPCLCLSSCSKEIYALPWDEFCYSADKQQPISLDLKDKEYVIDLLNECLWEDGVLNCGYDFIFHTQSQEVRYHSECGAFIDITRGKSAEITEAQRLKINGFLEHTPAEK